LIPEFAPNMEFGAVSVFVPGKKRETPFETLFAPGPVVVSDPLKESPRGLAQEFGRIFVPELVVELNSVSIRGPKAVFAPGLTPVLELVPDVAAPDVVRESTVVD
jgi:hypothetical protein